MEFRALLVDYVHSRLSLFSMMRPKDEKAHDTFWARDNELRQLIDYMKLPLGEEVPRPGEDRQEGA
jgi:hypothetical protein